MKKNIYPLEPEHYYHIFNRGNNGGKLFFEHKNYIYFLNLIKDKITPVANLYCYCLLPNHFHILVRIKSEKEIRESFPIKNDIDISKIISQQFSNAFNSYTQAINKRFSRTGKLFELPFRRKLIASETYVISSVLYIHNNPRKHKITDAIFEYPYSSLYHMNFDKNLTSEEKEIITLFSDIENFRYCHSNFN